MNTILFLAMKDLRLLLRDRVALFWVLGFPLLFALFLGAVVRAGLAGDQAPLLIPIVDRAQTPASEEFARRLAESPRIEILPLGLSEAKDAVRRSEAVAYVTLEGSELPLRVELGVDPTREVVGAFVQSQLSKANLPDGAAAPPSIGRDESVVQTAVGKGVRSASDYVFPAAVLWGLIGCAACFAVSMVTERVRGTFLRLAAAPIHRSAILGGKALACVMSCLTVSALLALGGALVFDIEVSRPDKLLVALLSAALCFAGITMLLSLWGRSEQAVAGAGWGTLIVMAMLGGAMVPLSMMPDWLLPWTHLSPVKWSIVALEGALWRDFTYSELALPCALLVAVGGAGFAAGLGVLSRSRAS